MKIIFPKFPRYTLLIVGVALIVFTALAPSYYFYTKYQQSQKLLRNPAEAAAEEARALIAQVGRVIDLPTGEAPTLATVSDKQKLSSQPFFAKSENGDKVLIFQQSKKAILYRPSLGKVIEVSTLNFTNEDIGTKAASQSAVPGNTIAVALYNGTTTVGLTAGAEKKLTTDSELGAKISITVKENAVKKDYTKTIVVVLTSVFGEEAQKIAKLLGGTVSALPEGEARPNADIAVIIGK
ncbi:LytR C-terminal domain-containing protein [Candidatus Gottesmanbacteria bacterium]|nr:LytR C-terminal domain-containing protein [Candidatus Gottesmanbacteria bacterium]